MDKCLKYKGLGDYVYFFDSSGLFINLYKIKKAEITNDCDFINFSLEKQFRDNEDSIIKYSYSINDDLIIDYSSKNNFFLVADDNTAINMINNKINDLYSNVSSLIESGEIDKLEKCYENIDYYRNIKWDILNERI